MKYGDLEAVIATGFMVYEDAIFTSYGLVTTGNGQHLYGHWTFFRLIRVVVDLGAKEGLLVIMHDAIIASYGLVTTGYRQILHGHWTFRLVDTADWGGRYWRSCMMV